MHAVYKMPGIEGTKTKQISLFRKEKNEKKTWRNEHLRQVSLKNAHYVAMWPRGQEIPTNIAKSKIICQFFIRPMSHLNNVFNDEIKLSCDNEFCKLF